MKKNTDGSFAKLFLCNFIREIGAHENVAWNFEVFFDDFGNEFDVRAVPFVTEALKAKRDNKMNFIELISRISRLDHRRLR